MLTTPFLTALDERARIKGSRDPLGLQAIWARFGRHVVANLTTVTQSLRDFTVLLLGIDLIERTAQEQADGEEVDLFLRWEQLAAYARVSVNHEEGVRGSRRVARFLNEGRGKVIVSAARQHQILGNQAIYGIWGLYMVAVRASGLVEAGATRLTAAGRELVEREHHARLASRGVRIDAIADLLARPRLSLAVEGSHRRHLEAVADILGSRVRAGERLLYRRHLLEGGPGESTEGRQAALVRHLERVPADEPLSPALFDRLSRAADKQGEASLAERLSRIRVCESVLAPAAALFTLVLTRDGRKVTDLAEHVRKAWGRVRTIDLDAVRALRAELGQAEPAVGDRLVAVAEGLVAGEYSAVVEHLVQQNRWVMGVRGGAPWVELNGDSLRVRVQDEPLDLPTRDELAGLWRFPYFVDSLRAVGRSLAEEAA